MGASICVHVLDVARGRCCCLETLGLLSSSTCSGALDRPVTFPDGIGKNAKVMKFDARAGCVLAIGGGTIPPVMPSLWEGRCLYTLGTRLCICGCQGRTRKRTAKLPIA